MRLWKRLAPLPAAVHGLVLPLRPPRLASEAAARRDVRRLRPQSAALPLLRALGIGVQRRPARPPFALEIKYFLGNI